MRRLAVGGESWALASAFVIARGAKTRAEVVVAQIVQSGRRGRGECTPYPRYGESVAAVIEQIESARAAIEAGCGRDRLQALLPPGAARNALDCALWDLEAKLGAAPVHVLAGLAAPAPVTTAYTLSLASPARMARAARLAAGRPVLKLKLGGEDDLDRVEAVRAAAPRSRLIVDANEALTLDSLRRLTPALSRLGVELIEQPLPAGEDGDLEGYACPVPLCADESLHSCAELGDCARRYSLVNIKLDKAGGLTEALALAAQARARGLGLMAGCMVATSLAMAPAMLLAQGADYVDLDGPLLLAHDREPGLVFEGSRIMPPQAALWG